MPTYVFHNTETDEYHEQFISNSAREQYLAENPNIKQVPSAPALLDSVRLGIRKPDEGFRDILRDIKKGAGRNGQVNTF